MGPPLPPPGAPLMAKFTPRTAQGYGRRHDHVEQRMRFRGEPCLIVAVAVVASRVPGVYTSDAKPLMPTPVAEVSQNVGFPGAEAHRPSGRPAQLCQLDAVLTADRNGDLKSAWQLANDLTREAAGYTRPGALHFHRASASGTVQRRRERHRQIDRRLHAAPGSGGGQRASRVRLCASPRSGSMPSASFADAAGTDPFNPDHFQHLGRGLAASGTVARGGRPIRAGIGSVCTSGNPGAESPARRNRIQNQFEQDRTRQGR